MQNHHSNKYHNYKAPEHHGPIHRVTQALANKFNIPRKIILAGFIIGVFVNFLLTLIVFLLALYWTNNPEKVERKFNEAASKVREWTAPSPKNSNQNQYAYAGSAASAGRAKQPAQDVDFDFSDLRRQFDDLENRTAGMEKHVSSEEYKLNKEFREMKKNGE
ncbi:hypothetical protein [Kiloniella antarctica]|uniref:Phage shock protein PspC N-terminal domain-containing protein n=1 Tax=Kiloniella antarctica TaxID=1550907 RepID=A0ABW5BLT0_9PROT